MGKRSLLLPQSAQHRQRGDDGVAGRVFVETDDVARILTAEHPFFFAHRLQHVAIADGRARERDAAPRQRLLETEIAHEGPDDAAGHATAPPVIERDDVEKLIPVVHPALGVDHHQPVAVAVEREPYVGVMLDHRRLQILGMRGADVCVDIQAIGLVADRDHLRSQLMKDGWSDVIRRAVSTIHHHLQPLEVELVREGALAEFDVAPGRVVDAVRLPELRRCDAGNRLAHAALDRVLDLIGKLGAGR